MHFDNTYPEADPGFRTADGFLKSRSELECFHCGKETTWFHLGNLLFFCCKNCFQQYTAGDKYRAPNPAPSQSAATMSSTS